MNTTSSTSPARGRNPRGQGERLRRDIIGATLRMLNELGDDQALSLRAVAREVDIAATSIYTHFSDRDALVLAALEQCTLDLLRDLDRPDSASEDPVARLRGRLHHLGTWVRDRAAVRQCMDAGVAPAADAAAVALDLRAAFRARSTVRLRPSEAI